MRLIVALLLGGAVSALVAAPAPFQRRAKDGGPWFAGWERPVDPKGGCRFDRRGGKLTIHVPGEGYALDYSNGRFDAPHLRRAVEGDFILTVRVKVADVFAVKGNGYRQAGLLVAAGERASGAFVEGSASDRWASNRTFERGGFGGAGQGGLSARESLWLRVRRHGETLESGYSFDGKSWCEKNQNVPDLVATTIVAVFVGSDAPGAFAVEFDECKFELYKTKAR